MAALWLQSCSLLVLLVLSWPGSQAVAIPQHLCGSHLVDALHLVCGDGGFYQREMGNVNPLLGALHGVNDFAFKDQMAMMVKRGIVEQCCHTPCSVVDLQSYCI